MDILRPIICTIIWGILVYKIATKIVEVDHIQTEPSLQYEQSQRRVRQNIKEMCSYINSELGKICEIFGIRKKLNDEIRNVIELSANHRRSLISDIDQLHSVDGYEKWRQKEAEDLSDIVQSRIFYLQNPVDCTDAEKVLCDMTKHLSGYASCLQNIVHCFVIGYATSHTVILRSKGWHYHRAGWEELFQEVSTICSDRYLKKRNIYIKLSHKYFEMNVKANRSAAILGVIPEDLATRLIKLHGDPYVWWLGQFLKYLLRPKYATKKIIELRMKRMGWKRPIVGVHIRRTDKIVVEASFHSVEEYMTYVEDYYLTQEIINPQIERRIFLATDDPDVITEARIKYPQYIIIGDSDIAKIANLSTRYVDVSAYGIITDLHMLSSSDYLVCTLSSNICRKAYAIMQNYYPDATYRIQSLDDIYYEYSQKKHFIETIIEHKPRNKNEIHIKSGDLIHIDGNHWNGFSIGTNERTHETGLFPSFKAKDIIVTMKLPTYPNASISIK